MPIERSDVIRALVFILSLGGFLGGLMLVLTLKEPRLLLLLPFAALLLPLLVAWFRGSNRRAKRAVRDPDRRNPRLAVSPRAAILVFLVPGIAAALVGGYLFAFGDEVWGAFLLILAAPVALLSWWALR